MFRHNHAIIKDYISSLNPSIIKGIIPMYLILVIYRMFHDFRA